jgi:uncharacterized protein
MKKLDLSEIVQNVGKRQAYEIDEPCWPESEEEGAVQCLGHVVGKVEFSNTGHLLLARGRVKADFDLECGRCLCRFPAPVEAAIEEQFEIPHYQGGLPRDEEEEEDEVLEDQEPLFVENILDLAELIRQTLLVELPIKPLCDETCKGLCAQCGKNLNEGACGCPEPVDSPFAGLADLLAKGGDKEDKTDSDED